MNNRREPPPREPLRAGARIQWIGGATSAALLLAIGFLPLTGGPRYEAALLAGLLVPSIAAVACALEVSLPERAALRSPLTWLGHGLVIGLAHALIIVLVALVHGARQGFCEPGPGFALLALGPGAGAALGGLWGSAVGLLLVHFRGASVRHRRLLSVVGGLAAPILAIVVSFVRFLTSPMVFAFDPFFGYFAGPLYEVVTPPLLRLATYRAGSLATTLAVLGLGLHVTWRSSSANSPRLSFVLPPHWGVTLATALFLTTSAGLAAAGPLLGHFSTSQSIRDTLGRSLSYGRCDVVFSKELPPTGAGLLARECDAHIAQLERYFETQGPERITVFLFADSAQKGLLMGAANTYIAKPWRREIYLQPNGFPHRVIGHELAHVVAGSFGEGPFRIAGPWGGWIPDPGRIEGVAVAAAPWEDTDVGLQEWAAAMRKIDLLPPLSNVFRLSFLGDSSTRAYTVAGAFMSFLRETHGSAVVRGWYGGATLEALTGQSIEALEASWHESLDAIDLSPQVLHIARARFERPSVFGRACPHAVDRLYVEAEQRLRLGDPQGADEILADVLRLDALHGRAQLLRPACDLRRGEVRDAIEGYREIANDLERPTTERAQALEAIGDAAAVTNADPEAFDTYTAALDLTVDEHARRAIEVKRWALRASEPARSAITALLIGPPEKGPRWDVAAPLLGAWAALDPKSGMPKYLLGKNLLGRGHFGEAAGALEAALSRQLPLDSVRVEALRSLLIASCALSDPPRAERAFRRLADESLSAARREGIERFAERCGIDVAKPTARGQAN